MNNGAKVLNSHFDILVELNIHLIEFYILIKRTRKWKKRITHHLWKVLIGKAVKSHKRFKRRGGTQEVLLKFKKQILRFKKIYGKIWATVIGATEWQRQKTDLADCITEEKEKNAIAQKLFTIYVKQVSLQMLAQCKSFSIKQIPYRNIREMLYYYKHKIY